MSLKSKLLQLMEDNFSIDENVVAENLAQVIRGETTTETFDAKGNVVSRKVLKRPEDLMYGVMVYDAMSGGDIGIAPQNMINSKHKARARTHKKLGIDERVIINPMVDEVKHAEIIELSDE